MSFLSPCLLYTSPQDALIVTLEIAGRNYSSEEFAAWIEDCSVRGKSHICFVIGGSLGPVSYTHLDVYKRQLLGRPSGFELNVREAYVSAGAGFVVVLTGAFMTMPGLPKAPAAYNIDVDNNGKITGLF